VLYVVLSLTEHYTRTIAIAMAPSLLRLAGVAATAYAAGASASVSYVVSEVYNSTNFLDKFGFFSVSYL
jgi:hypothetical protein